MTYILPIPEGTDCEILRDADHARYGVCFKVPLGTPVLAARSGTVVIFRDDSPRKVTHAGDANFIRIDHGDGTYSEYAHLGYKEIFVRKEQQVWRGDVIGRTGLSAGMDCPHLLFTVFRMVNNKPVSIPVEFE